MFLLSFQAQAKNPPPGTGTSDIPANILIMLDNSGSMSAKMYNSVQVYYPLDVATDSSGNIYVMEYYNSNPQALEQVRAPLLEDKVIDFLLEASEVTEKNISSKELKKITGATEVDGPMPV